MVDWSNDVAKRQLSHDEFHAWISRGWITFSTRDVVNPKDGSSDDQDDESKELDAT